MRQRYIHRVIEYIKAQTEFPFDTIDVEAALEEVLKHYGFIDEFTAAEQDEIKQCLLPLGQESQMREVMRILA